MQLDTPYSLLKFLDSFEYLTEIRNLDAINPVRVKIRNSLSGAEFIIIGSYAEPRAPLVPIHGIWINLDPSSLQYRTVYKLVAFTANSTTPEFRYSWEAITTYEDLFTYPQVYLDLVGSVGETGTIGLKGEIGSVGPTGNLGAQGDIGPVGTTGVQGPTGVNGIRGPRGVNGIRGPRGATGTIGAKGLVGDTGALGNNGARGVNGVDGLIFAGVWRSTANYVPKQVVVYNGSAYNCTATNLNAIPSGTPSKWSILIPKGAQGPQGAQGPIGTYVVDYDYIRANRVTVTGIVISGPTNNPSYPTSTNVSVTYSTYNAVLYLSNGTSLQVSGSTAGMTDVTWSAITVGSFNTPMYPSKMTNGTYIGGQSGSVNVAVTYKTVVYTGTLAVSTY